MSKVYVVFGCEYHSADYALGVYSTLEKAIDRAHDVMNDQDVCYDEMEVRETTLDSMDDGSYAYWKLVWTSLQ